jgi:hemerythrin superfamily protein
VVDRALSAVIDVLTEEPSATTLLVKQHQLVKALFKKIESTPAHADKLELFEELARNLVAHDAIEREIFYPACEKALGMSDLLGESLVEHGVIEFCVYEADQATKEDFAFKCRVLGEMVLHHAREEETELLPRVQKTLGKAQLERLGKQMQERFERAKAQDFRAQVYDNLKQVLAGAVKTSKRAPKSAKRPAKSPKSAARPSKKSGKRRRAARRAA